MHYERHIIRNFPENYPLWKKILANIIFYIGGTIIHHRKNLLSKQDIKKTKKILRPGDIILVGGLRRISSLIIKGPVTHAMFYIGYNRIIHAVVDGVEIDHLYDIFCEYDTVAVLRSIDSLHDSKKYSKKIKKALSYTHEQLGKPFDFEFTNDNKKLYCSELIYRTFKNAGLDPGFTVSDKHKTIHPLKFINNHFHLLFLSHNLKLVNGKINVV